MNHFFVSLRNAYLWYGLLMIIDLIGIWTSFIIQNHQIANTITMCGAISDIFQQNVFFWHNTHMPCILLWMIHFYFFVRDTVSHKGFFSHCLLSFCANYLCFLISLLFSVSLSLSFFSLPFFSLSRNRKLVGVFFTL